jgi:cobalt transporter subunit CbtA
MFGRLLIAALITGVSAGLIVSAGQAVRVSPLIYYAETFEEAAQAEGSAHAHDDGSLHDHGGAGPGSFQRIALTVLANSLAGIGFGLVMGAAMIFANRHVNWRRGLLWGLAGFVVFALGPALQLPPDPPGIDLGSVELRGAIWAFIAFMSGLGLWLIAFRKSWWWKAVGVAVLVLPQVAGIPEFVDDQAVVPDAVIDQFIAAALLTTGVFWLCLGGIMGGVYSRLVQSTPAR